MVARAIRSVRLDVSCLPLSEQFYKELGMVEAIGRRRQDQTGVSSVLADNDPSGPAASVALRWPSDPFMLLTLVQAEGPRSGDDAQGVWPRKPGHAGSSALSLLVDDVHAETSALVAAGLAEVVSPAAETSRLGGATTSAFVRDPGQNLVELISESPHDGFDTSRCSVARAGRTFLHAECNVERLGDVSPFYAALGMTHNALNDGRPGADIAGDDPDKLFIECWGEPLMDRIAGMEFLRLAGDHSQMHLELMGYRDGGLHDPTDHPVWNQKGIMRFCFKATGVRELRDELLGRGVRIFNEEIATASLNWGDSEWFFFADPDGNILTFEEWFPAGRWGQRF